MFAAKYGHQKCLRWLVCDAAADYSLRAEDDSGVFDWAVFGGDLCLASWTSRLTIHVLPFTFTTTWRQSCQN